MAKTPAKQEAANNAVVTTGGSNLPEYLKDYQGGSGLRGLDASDFIIPRIKLLQGISEEVTAFDAANAGEFWVNVLDYPLGATFDFVPLLNRKRYMLLPPMGDPRGVFARADDGIHWRPNKGEWQVKLKGVPKPVTWTLDADTVRASGLAEFGTSNPDDPDSNPAATLFNDYLVLLRDRPDFTSPVMISLARSSAKKARDLQGKIEFGAAPMQARAFRVTAVPDQNANGEKFMNWQFQANGYVPEADYLRAKKIADDFGSVSFRGAEDEDTGEAAGNAQADESKEY